MTRFEIPLDIQNEIYSFVNYSSRNEFNLLDKYWNKRYTQFIKKINLIQKSYRKYRVPKSYLNGNKTRSYYFDPRLTYIHANNNKSSIILIRRYYLSKYPFNHLQNFPEYLANQSINSSDRTRQLHDYIIKMPSNNSRTIRHIKNFLDDNNITKKELSYYGW